MPSQVNSEKRSPAEPSTPPRTKRLDEKETPVRSSATDVEENITLDQLKNSAAQPEMVEPQPGCKIDQDFGKAIVGMSVLVPNRWWNKCTGNHLHKGEIIGFNPNADKHKYFCLRIDIEPQDSTLSKLWRGIELL